VTRLPTLALLAAFACPAVAAAQGIDLSSGGPVEVTARDGFEWRENEQIVIANGDARAVRENVVVTADRLIAYYRKKAPAGTTQAAAAQSAPAQSAPAQSQDATDTGGNEVYRLEAEGHVLISTPTDQAQGDHAVYDIDQAVLVLTGHDLKLTTPQQVLTARDTLEYWSQQHMAVARGKAVVLTTDGRRIAADVLVGYTTDTGQGGAAKPTPVAAAAPKPTTSTDPLATSGKLERAEGFGNVEVRTATDIARGDRGVYVTATGMARLVGHVRVTHGENQMEGPAADVNMNTGIAHLVADAGDRVQGLIMPNSAQAATSGSPAPAKKP
jgi:lipopolysaccharide export system protein LptA